MSENMYRRRSSHQVSQFQVDSSQWVDQPRPSGGYISFFLCFPLLMLLILGFGLIWTYFVAGASSIGVEGIIFAFLFVGFAAIFGLLLRAGYRIKYMLDEYTLHLYAGQRVTFSIPLHQISQVRKTTYNRRLIGWGIGNAGLCNRFSNGVCLKVTKGQSSYDLYITPTNPDEFLARLNGLRQRSDAK